MDEAKQGPVTESSALGYPNGGALEQYLSAERDLFCRKPEMGILFQLSACRNYLLKFCRNTLLVDHLFGRILRFESVYSSAAHSQHPRTPFFSGENFTRRVLLLQSRSAASSPSFLSLCLLSIFSINKSIASRVIRDEKCTTHH